MKNWTVDVLYWLGACLIAAGLAIWSIPVGFVAGGGFCLLASFLSESGGEGTDRE